MDNGVGELARPSIAEVTANKPTDSVRTVSTPKIDFLLGSSIGEVGADQILGKFAEGLPTDYMEYGRDKYVDSEEDPHFLIKKRAIGEDYIRRYRATPRDEKKGGYTPQQANAAASLGNELKVAELVDRVVSTDEGQRFAKDNGFESIEVVKPLAGFIVKDNGEKYMIYPFVQGEAWSRLDPNVGFQDSAPVQGLIDLLRKNGVMPTDLVGRQIMIDGNKMLLTDMEVYHPISKDEG